MSNTATKGILYIIPNTLGKTPENNTIPEYVLNVIRNLEYFVVENIQQSVKYLQWVGETVPDYKIEFYPLDDKVDKIEKANYVKPLRAGKNVGLLSDAGLPAVADPGHEIVRMAHQMGAQVVPLVGPSSIMLALMASGLGGQQFAFHGYLPRNDKGRRDRINELEKSLRLNHQTQIFMEAPHRNLAVYNTVLDACRDTTWFCIATNLTLPGEEIVSQPIEEWRKKKNPPQIKKKPAIFILWDPTISG